jgi:hypothetical protein
MDINDPDEFKQVVMDTRSSLRELQVLIEDLIWEEDQVAARLGWPIIDRVGKEIHRETIESQVVEHWGLAAWRTEKSS